MKVMRGVAASIVVALGLMTGPTELGAAEAATTCAEDWQLCVNEASQTDGFFERTRAEQRCNWAWYNCVKREMLGS